MLSKISSVYWTDGHFGLFHEVLGQDTVVKESHPFPVPFILLSLTQHTQKRREELIPNNITNISNSQWSLADLQRFSVK